MWLSLVQILLHSNNISLFLASKDMYFVSLKLLTYLFIWGSFTHNGLIFLSSLYPMKNSFSFFIFTICRCIRYYFIGVHIVCSDQIFERMKLFLFSFIIPNFKNCLTISLISYLGKIIFFNRRKDCRVFLSTNYICVSISY